MEKKKSDKQGLTSYCRISKFVEKKFKNLYNLMDDTCIFGQLKPFKQGITLLIPTDETIAKLEDLIHSDTKQVIETLLSHIIRDSFADNKSWRDRSDSKMGDVTDANRKKVTIASHGKDGFTVNGVEAKKDDRFVLTEFTDMEGKSKPPNQFVWVLAGEMKLPTEQAKKKVKGGFIPQPIYNKSRYAQSCLNQYTQYVFKYLKETKIENPLIEDIVTILRYTKTNNQEFYTKISPLMSNCIVTNFCILMNELNDNDFREWFSNGRGTVSKPMSSFNDELKSIPLQQLSFTMKKKSNISDYKENFDFNYSNLGIQLNIDKAKLFNYHFAMYYEATQLLSAEQEIVAAIEKQLLPSEDVRSFFEHVKTIAQFVCGKMNVFNSNNPYDTNVISTLISSFGKSDLFCYLPKNILPADTTIIANSAVENFLPIVAAHNLQYYCDMETNIETLIPQLSSLSNDKWQQLLDKVNTSRQSSIKY